MNPVGHHANGYRVHNLASTNSQNYSDFHPSHSNSPIFPPDISQQHQQHQQQHSHMSHRNVQNQWQQHASQMNGSQSQMNNTPPPATPQLFASQFNQMAWGNQMAPPQGFPNGMPPMGFNLPFIPQQIFQEAYALSAPVEAADEPFLLNKLLESSRKGESYKDGLNSLHGKHGHSASLWKDYYLDHRERIDAWIAMCLQKEKEQEKGKQPKMLHKSASSDIERLKASQPIKKPSPALFKREPSPYTSTSRLSVSTAPVKRGRPRKKSQSNHSTPPIVLEQSTGSRRSTINSLTAPAPVFGGHLPAPNADIKIPDPPSRSPTPPTIVIPHRGRGNKFTPDDREYFIKFIGWRLKHDPTLTRNDLCELLAQKAPHHTSQSWASHWSGHHDVPDKILAAARGEEEDNDDSASSGEEEEGASMRKKPNYKDTSTTDEEEDEDEDEESKSEGDSDDDAGEVDDDAPIRHYSEKDMGEKGAPFTEADMYMTAKYIVSFPNWHATSSKLRWEPYVEKFSQRSAKSWAEYYRRNESEILKLARKIKNESASSLNTQYAKPTRTPPNAKRKAEFDSSEDPSTKRGRASDTA